MDYANLFSTWLLFTLAIWWFSQKNWNLFQKASLVFLFCLSALFFLRIKALFFPLELNPDESQLLAQALRVSADGIPWRGFDGTTSGPVATYFATAGWFFGDTNPYLSLRFFSLIIICLTLAFFFVSSSILIDKNNAKLPFLLLILFYFGSSQADFVHHSSEVIPVFLLSIQFFFLALVLTGKLSPPAASLALGAITAVIFFTKPQAAPLAAIALVPQLAWAFLSNKQQNNLPFQRYFITQIAFWAIGALLPTAFILLPVILSGSFYDFWVRYVLLAIEHRAAHNLPTSDNLRQLLLSG